MYKDFGALPIASRPGRHCVAARIPNQKIPVNVWLRGRIAGMLAKASPTSVRRSKRRLPRNGKRSRRRKTSTPCAASSACSTCRSRVGREARIRLAETIMESNDRPSFLEAELLRCIKSWEANSAANRRPAAGLWRSWHSSKKRRAPSIRCGWRPPTTANSAAISPRTRCAGTRPAPISSTSWPTDKRFLPFLEEPGNPSGPGQARRARTSPPARFTSGIAGFVMPPHGDQTPFAQPTSPHPRSEQRHSTRNVRLRDLPTNQDRWETDLGHVPMNQQLIFNLYQQANINQAYHPNARFRFYHVKGHLIVCQVGVMVYGLDGDTGKKLWEMQTVRECCRRTASSISSKSSPIPGRQPGIPFLEPAYQPAVPRHAGPHRRRPGVLCRHPGPQGADRRRSAARHDDVEEDRCRRQLRTFSATINTCSSSRSNENGSFGAGRTFRASDGETRNAPDFSSVYQSRIRVLGRQILAAQSRPEELHAAALRHPRRQGRLVEGVRRRAPSSARPRTGPSPASSSRTARSPSSTSTPAR